MARIRTIKPEFFTSEDVVSLSAFARLLYIAMWCEADREGRIRWKPKTFKIRYFPADSVDIDALCRELIDRRLVVLYGDGLAHIPSFRQHQHVNPRESASVLPDPVGKQAGIDASGTRDDASVTHREEGKEGKEGKERMASQPSAAIGSLASEPAPEQSDGPAPEPDDPLKAMFDLGLSILSSTGHSERSARAFVGRMRKTVGDEEALRLLVAAKATTDPAAYIAKAMQPKPVKVQLC